MRLTEKDVERFWAKVDKSGPNGCWVWTAGKPDGYGKFGLDGRTQRAHRVNWVWTNGPIPEGLCVLHKCDNRMCVRPDHLFLGTRPDNNKDRNKKGRQARGSANGRAKLTEFDVRRIRALANLGCPQVEITEVFGISKQSVSEIVNRKTWRHVA